MVILGQLFSFLIVLSIIVLVHETGHFFAARLMNVRVEVFSFGLGKRLFGCKKGNTDFRVSLIPLGGYVRMAGEEDFDPQNLKPDEFYAKNRGQRIFILVMGATMNILLALALIAVINMTGVEIESYKLFPPEIGYVEKNSPADQAGLQRGDRIITVNGKKVLNWRELEITVGTSPKEKLQIGFLRQGHMQQTELSVATGKKYEIGYAGFYWNLPAEIDYLEPNFPAEKAGLKKGDRVLAVNSSPVYNYFELRDMIHRYPEKSLVLTIRRGSEQLDIPVVPRNLSGYGIIGFNVKVTTSEIKYNLFQAVTNSVSESVRLTVLTFNAIRKMISGKLSPRSMSGPLDIAEFSHRALQSGPSSFFMLIAFISLQLGLVNLLPVPGLDGGHLMIYTVEAIIRRDLNQKLKTVLIYIGFALLMVLMVYVILNDIAKKLPHGWHSLLPFIK